MQSKFKFSLATIYRWYNEFERNGNNFQHKKEQGVMHSCYKKNIAAVKKIINLSCK